MMRKTGVVLIIYAGGTREYRRDVFFEDFAVLGEQLNRFIKWALADMNQMSGGQAKPNQIDVSFTLFP
jgi:hypothetical protein